MPQFSKSTVKIHPISRAGHAGITAHEKHERLARSMLHDLIVFYEALEQEMDRLRERERQGIAIDMMLYRYMEKVQAAYQVAIDGFRTFDVDHQRNLLIVFADAVQDMITHIHKRREG